MLEGARVAVIGGGSGMGLAIAQAAAVAGADVWIGGRSSHKLEDAAQNVRGGHPHRIDMTDETSVEAFFDAIGEVDHLVVTASEALTGKLRELPVADAIASMSSKFWGPYRCVRAARLRADGSVTLFSGLLSRRPMAQGAAFSAVNAAVEALGRALARELAPVRVNTISPGLVDTGAYDSMPAADRERLFADMARALPAGRVGAPSDIAAAALMLMANRYITGVTLDVDGGGMLVGTKAS